MYQGRLNDGGGPANGAYDLRFALYDAPTNGNAISAPQTNFAMAVTGGLFTTNLDFGPVFTGTNYWLSIGVRTNGDTNAFTLLWPRQPLLPVPYAIFATTASNLSGTLPATQLAGTLSSAQLSGTYLGQVTFTNSGNNFYGAFSGNGTNLTNLNGSQIASGTVVDARLSGNVALLNASQTFTGTNFFTNANVFTNRGNAFTGSFFGNGLVGWIPVYGTATQAVANAGYLLLNSNLTTVTLPTTNSLLVSDIVRISGPGGGWNFAQTAGETISGGFLNPTNASWLPANVASKGWRAIASSADGVKMVASAIGSGGIYVSTDSGKTWNSSSTFYSPTSLASSANGTRLVGGIYGGSIILSTNSGSSWNLITAAGSPLPWTGVASSADGSKFAACISNSTIYVWSNFGATSNFPASPLNKALTAISCSADCSRLAATVHGGAIYTSANSGSTWAPQSGGAPTSANWSCIASSYDGYKLAAAVNGGNIYTSTDAGATWTARTNAPVAAWSAITSSSDGGRIAAVVNSGGIYVSGNYGLTWTKQSVDDQDWYSIAAAQDLSAMAAVSSDTGTTGKIYYWQAAIQSTTTTPGVGGSITGSAGSAVELQYIGGGIFVPVSSIGVIWAN